MFDMRAPRPIFQNLSAGFQERDLSDYVLRMHTRKTLSTQAGTWEVTLVPQPDQDGLLWQSQMPGLTKDNWESFVYRSIRPMDVVLLGMTARDESGLVVDQVFMLGFVHNVYKSKATDSDRVDRSIKVRGRDATMLFMEDHIANAPELAGDKGLRALIGDAAAQLLNDVRGMVSDDSGKTRKNVFVDSYPPEALYWILSNAPTIQLTLDYFGEQKKAKDIFMPLLSCRKEDKVFDEKLNQYAGLIERRARRMACSSEQLSSDAS